MTTRNWITSSEATQILKGTEDEVKQLVERSIIRGYRENGAYYVDKDHLVGWMRRRKAPCVEVAEIYNGVRRTLLEYHKTIYAKEQAQLSGTRGALYGTFGRDFLQDHLPRKFYIGSGQVLGSNHVLDDKDLITEKRSISSASVPA